MMYLCLFSLLERNRAFRTLCSNNGKNKNSCAPNGKGEKWKKREVFTSDPFIHKLLDGAGPMAWKMRGNNGRTGSLKYIYDFADLKCIYCGCKGTARQLARGLYTNRSPRSFVWFNTSSITLIQSLYVVEYFGFYYKGIVIKCFQLFMWILIV
jgi:hypothetical protein